MWLNPPGRVIFNEDKERHKEDRGERDRWRDVGDGERDEVRDSLTQLHMKHWISLWLCGFYCCSYAERWPTSDSLLLPLPSTRPPSFPLRLSPTHLTGWSSAQLFKKRVCEAESCDTVNTEEGKHPFAFSNQSSLRRYNIKLSEPKISFLLNFMSVCCGMNQQSLSSADV